MVKPETAALIERALDDMDANLTNVEGFNAYYDGTQTLRMLGINLPRQMHALQTSLNWPRLAVDAHVERLRVEGFRFADDDSTNAKAWDIWQANRMEEGARLGHTEACVQGLAYITVGAGEEGELPTMHVESRRTLHAVVDPRTRKVRYAVRALPRAKDSDPRRVTLYLPDQTVTLVEGETSNWSVQEAVKNGLGAVPVIPLVNKARIDDYHGRSEMADVIPIADAACRAVTVLQGAQELEGLPQQYIFGVNEKDFQDAATGQPIPKWEAYFGRLRAITEANASVTQLRGADLTQFTQVVDHYGRQAAALTGLPRHYLGLTADTAESADAIRAGESRLIMRCRDRAVGFSGAWEQAMRLALTITGDLPKGSQRLETVWASPETPTYAAKADAVTKLVQSGILPARAALEELGYSPERVREIELYRAREPLAILAGSGAA